MTCPFCGATNTPDARFCVGCGADLGVRDAGSAAAPAAAPVAAQLPSYGQTPSEQQTAAPSQPVQQTYAQPYGAQQPYDQSYAQTYAQQDASAAYGQQGAYGTQQSYYAPTPQPAAMSSADQTLRLVNFILCLLSTVVAGILIIPLAWMVPMTVHSWGIYKGTKANTVAFGVCTLLFVSLIGGILLLVSTKDR